MPAGHADEDLRGGARARPARAPRARDHRLAGRDRSSPTDERGLRRARRAGRADRARRRGACGGSASRASSRSRSCVERRARDVDRPLPGRRASSCMLDGVLENFTGAMLEPYLDGDGRADRQPRHRLRSTPRSCADAVTRARRARVPAALPRDRRPGRARRARRGRGRPARQRPVRHAPAHRPHPGHPPRRHPAVPRARRGGQRPAATGRSTRTRWTS